MEIKFYLKLAFLLVFPIAIPLGLYLGESKIFLQILFFTSLSLGIIDYLLNNEYVYLTTCYLFFTHTIRSGTVVLFITLFLAIILCQKLVNKNLQKSTAFKYCIASIMIGTLFIFLLKNYSFNMAWSAMLFQSLSVFLISQLSLWDFKKIEKVIFWHLFLMTLYGFFEALLTDKARLEGPVDVATGYGVVMAIEWVIIYSNLVVFRKFEFKTILLLIFSLLIIFMTGTRMALIGLEIGMLATAILVIANNSREKSRAFIFFKIGVMALSIMLLSLIAWSVLPDNFSIKKRNVSEMTSGNIDASNWGRIAAWYASGTIIKENLAVGIGRDNFRSHEIAIYKRLGLNIEKLGIAVDHSHNLFLAILTEYGIFGFQIFICIMIFVFRSLIFRFKSVTHNKSAIALLCGMLVLLTLGLFDAIPFGFTTITWAAWLFGSIIRVQTVFMSNKVTLPGL